MTQLSTTIQAATVSSATLVAIYFVVALFNMIVSL